MHNGIIADFPKVKRRLRSSLSDKLYNFLQGTTDSEHAFAVFLNELDANKNSFSADELEAAMISTINKLTSWCEEARIDLPSIFNFAVTDGETVIATRFSSKPEQHSESLYYAAGTKFTCRDDGVCLMDSSGDSRKALVIASEPLTDYREYWEPVPLNHLLKVTKNLEIDIVPIS